MKSKSLTNRILYATARLGLNGGKQQKTPVLKWIESCSYGQNLESRRKLRILVIFPCFENYI
jgi:hypothetical protein